MKVRVLAAVAAATLSVLVSAPAHATAPTVTWDSNSVSTVYPAADGYVDSIGFSWTVAPVPNSLTLEIVKTVPGTDGQTVYAVRLESSTTSWTWDGRTTGGTSAGAGDYYPVLLADNGTDPVAPAAGWHFTVSAKRLVSKTWTKSVSAAGSLKAKQVGSCSTLRKPGTMLGSGSLGYYSLARCGRTANGAGNIVTLHGLTLPAATRPGKLRFSVYSGAVKSGGHVALTPFTPSGQVIDSGAAFLGRARAWHSTPSVSATKMLQPGRHIVWGIVALPHSRYDVKTIKVTYTYQLLQ